MQDFEEGGEERGAERPRQPRIPAAELEHEIGTVARTLLRRGGTARPGGGKSRGYRTLLSARIASRYVFLHGFPKSDKANITQDEKKALQFAGKVFLELSAEALMKAMQSGALMEVHCEQNH